MHSLHRFVRRNTHTLLHQASHQLQEWVLHEEEALNRGEDLFTMERNNFAITWSETPSTPATPSALSSSRASAMLSVWATAHTPPRLTGVPSPMALPGHPQFLRAQPQSMVDLPRAADEAPVDAVGRPLMRRARTAPAPARTVFSNQGDSVLTVQSGLPRVWDLSTPDSYLELGGLAESEALQHCVFSPNDRYVLAAAANKRVLYLWNLSAPQEPHVLEPPGEVLDLSFSKNGQRIAATCADAVALWQADDLQAGPTLLKHAV